ncbi:multidrug resistance protein fnx1 [Kockovaella imperatae]|uniref:Multidrug resistance protein fnx1 n=1 Tax=Kockovaella imperatae TaxID=4999 RepID=A0A1Y1UPG8_9TREE|nr:multidrug resistance protein fnx1 [Kockovaella imperatae]ORX39938.1 multidrug resistance protein fnx1 [Kockovaella imperatae]
MAETPETEPLLPKPHHNLLGLTAWRFRIVCVSVWSLTFFVSLDSTLVATLLTPIGSFFQVSNQAQWIGTSYLLSLCCFTPIYGRLSDLLGRKTALCIGLTLFVLGTAGCGLAPSMAWLIVARVVAGMGGGGLQSVSVIVVTDLVGLRRRGLFQGYGNIFFATGAAVGAPAGGIINDKLGWRWAFYLQLPFLAIAAIMLVTQFKVPRPPTSSNDKGNPLKRLDWLGSLTLVSAVGTLLIGISLKTSSSKSDGTNFAWSDPKIYGLLIAAAVLIVSFVLVEGFWAVEPLLPLSFLTRRTPAAVCLSSLVMVTNMFSIMFNIPLYCSTVLLASASQAGAHLTPYTLLLGLGSLEVGWVMRRTGKYWWLSIFHALLLVLTGVLMFTWSTKSPGWMFWVAQMPSAFGYGAILTTSLVALMTDVVRQGKGETAVATSMTYMFRMVGQVFGVSLSQAIIQAIVAKDLTNSIQGPRKQEIIQLIRHSASSIRDLEPVYRDAAVAAYQHALHTVFICNLVLTIVNTCILTAVKEEEMPEQRASEAAD